MAVSPPPRTLPVFPLTGVLLLPGMLLPLHIFEPRYRHMVADALEQGGHIGMIQPFVPRQDNRPPPGAELEQPELYTVGCAGRLEHHEQAPDGRYLIHLRGAIRFRVVEELPLRRGYRCVTAEYDSFREDAQETARELDAAPLLEAFEAFSTEKAMAVDWQDVHKLPGMVLLNSLAMSLPFSPAEKQALLEAPNPGERARTLIALLGGLGSTVDPLAMPEPPEVN
jgi:Lon protease-like protein